METEHKAPYSLWKAITDLEDIMNGVERARKTFLIILEDVTDEFCAPNSEIHYPENGRLKDYLAALYLIEDCFSKEQDKIGTAIDELMELHKSNNRPAPPEVESSTSEGA